MRFRKVILPAAVGLVLSSCSWIQKISSKNNTRQMTAQSTVVKADTIKKSGNNLKPYKEVITDKAFTKKGLFTIHKVNERYFFELPTSMLNKDILIVSRISKAAAGNRPAGGFEGYAGDYINENVISFFKGPNHKIFLEKIGYGERASDTSENGMHKAVMNSNIQPIVAAFDIKAYSDDSVGIVIDMTDYINSDNDILFFSSLSKEDFGLGGIQADRSFIREIRTFPLNIEISTVKTYAKSQFGSVTYELNSSLVCLPEKLMRTRQYDKRIGYLGEKYLDFDKRTAGYTSFIARWRLEPKEEDKERYLKGELVAPKNPIVYYIDPATPKKWVSYLIAGVNDWQKAFEKVGFKGAIYALEAPVDDPEWSLEDARHNAIVYKPSIVSNAMGPHVHDPRTGEILETHIEWFNNIMALLQKWYFIQVSPNDPRARKMEMDDSLVGELIRYAVAHEVGHTLGLQHDMAASSTIPVDSLRSKSYVEANGFCPSIMDYARFNYVAQPEDSISMKGLWPRIGVYDEWAIEYGYRWFPEFKTKDEENTFLTQWVTKRINADKRLWYGDEMIPDDPRITSEAVGDDAMKAGHYGIKNLQRVMSNLIKWTNEPNKIKSDVLQVMRKGIIEQYQRYLQHVAINIGGTQWTYKTFEEKGPMLEFTSRERQKEAVQFFQDELFKTPEWLMNKDVFFSSGGLGAYQPMILQKEILEKILTHTTFSKLLFFETSQPDKAYTFIEFLNDLEKGILKELKERATIDVYRRNLQKVYVEQLIRLIQFNSNLDGPSVSNINTDAFSIVKGYMYKLSKEIESSIPYYKDDITKWHLRDLNVRLKKALAEDKKNIFDPASLGSGKHIDINGISTYSLFLDKTLNKDNKGRSNCWYDDSENE